MTSPLRAAVFASGGGTNLQSLLDHGAEAWTVALVVSDRPDAGALERAGRAYVPRVVIPHGSDATDDPSALILTALAEHDIDFVLLAGYMKLVPAAVVDRYADRMVNVHPALLPSFGGKGMYGIHVHRAVLEAGVRLTGPTVHLVDEVYDRGRIIAQWPVPVKPTDTPEHVAARVLRVEHSLYPRVVDHLVAAWRAGRTPGPLDEPGETFRLVDPPNV